MVKLESKHYTISLSGASQSITKQDLIFGYLDFDNKLRIDLKILQYMHIIFYFELVKVSNLFTYMTSYFRFVQEVYLQLPENGLFYCFNTMSLSRIKMDLANN